jgi:hypothetical protein
MCLITKVKILDSFRLNTCDSKWKIHFIKNMFNH